MSRLRDTLNAAQDRAEEAADSARDTGSSVADGARDLADPNQSSDWVPGVEEARESEQFQRRQQEYNEADGVLGRFDAATAAGSDFILDNERGSVQDAARSGIERLTGLDSEEQAEAAQDVDDGVTESIDSAVEGTAFDNRGTDAVRTGGDLLLGELVRTGVGASTGIDTEEGDTEARTGALELADIGLTVGTAGAGRAGLAAARSSDDVGGLLGRALGRGGDDAAEAGARSGDDVARAADDASDGLPAVRGTDDVARAGDDAGSAAARGADDDTIRMTEDADGVFSMAGRSADDAGSAAARSADEAGGLAGRIGDTVRSVQGAAARSADDATQAASRAGDSLGDVIRGAARSADDAASRAARAGDEATGAIRAGGSRAGAAARSAPARAGAAARNRPLTTAAVGGAGALVAGGAAHQKLFGGADEVELEDEDGNTFYIHRSGSFEPTERRPDGGVLWRVEQDGSTEGYTVVLTVEGDTVTLLSGDGGEMVSTLAAEDLQNAAARAEERRQSGGRA